MTRGVRNRSKRAARALALLLVGVLVAGTLAVTAAAAGAAEPLAKLKITADNVQNKQKGKSGFKDAKNGMGLKQGSTTITVAGNLAFTGSSDTTETYVLVGIAAVVVGSVLVVGTRRRRRGLPGRYGPPSVP